MEEVEDFDQNWTPKEEIQRSAQPTADNVQLATLTLLMRIYDVQMKILAGIDEDAAAELWELHNSGESLNPMIWLTEPQDDNEN